MSFSTLSLKAAICLVSTKLSFIDLAIMILPRVITPSLTFYNLWIFFVIDLGNWLMLKIVELIFR
jgi:hypothetical protein